MIQISMDNLAKVIDCRYSGKENIFFNKMVLDSRKTEPGDLFIASAGNNTDGHNFIQDALNKGAVGVLSAGATNASQLPATNYIFTNHLEECLNKIAVFIRDHSKAEVIGVTGSVGKTTTKDMLHSIFSAHHQCIKTEGNFNNELGLPLTMSRADDHTEYMVLEMGMRGLGEIRYLADITKPRFAIITNIEPVHAEILGSLENIAKAKAEIAESLPANGALIISKRDQKILERFIKNTAASVYTVGFEDDADFVIVSIDSEKEKETTCTFSFKNEKYQAMINTIGRHNVLNAAMAYLAGILAGLPADSFKGLSQITFSEMRFRIRESNGYKLINDAYNANPRSVSYALDSFSSIESSRKIFIFGDMFELGDYEIEGHRLIANKILEHNIDLVFLLGQKVEHTLQAYFENGGDPTRIFYFKNKNDLLKNLKTHITKGDAMLLKASRGMHLETLEKEIEEYIHE